MYPLQRVVLVVDPEQDARPVFAAARSVIPAPASVHVLALLSGRKGREGLAEVLEGGPLLTWPGLPESSFEAVFDASRILEVARSFKADVVVIGPWAASRSARSRVLRLLELAGAGFAVLSVGAGCCTTAHREGAVGIAIDAERTALAPLAAHVREQLSPAEVVAFIQGAKGERLSGLELALRALFPGRSVEAVEVDAARFDEAAVIAKEADARGVGLVVASTEDFSPLTALVSGFFAAQLLQDSAHPVLVLPRGAQPPGTSERLVASDALLIPGVGARIALERTGMFGRTALAGDEEFVIVGRDEAGPLTHEGGVLELPPSAFSDPLPDSLALLSRQHERDLVAMRVVRPGGSGSCVVVDAELSEEALRVLGARAGEADFLFVRLRATPSLDVLRARLLSDSAFASPVTLIDASAFFDDAGAIDLPTAVDPQRLLRLAHRLLASGFPIAAVIAREGAQVVSPLVPVLTDREVAEQASLSLEPVLVSASRSEILTGTRTRGGHAVELELDNRGAREWLLSSIATARERVHLQSYMVEGDSIAGDFVTALGEAGRRGVQVRVLVDALYTLHEAFGLTRRMLEQLAQVENVEVRSAQPLLGLPKIEDLKQRNHRKLAIFDGAVATVTGRNLAREYYTNFGELQLTPESPYLQVPWIDAGLRLRGPAVMDLERSFLSDWQRAGGEGFDVKRCDPAGDVSLRLVLHDGLRDAHSYEAHLDLIERARERLLVVNTFPLVLELQRALIAAMRRGVTVQMLIGNVRPRWGAGETFEGGGFRELGDDLVRARLEPVIRAGAEVWEAAVNPPVGWDPTLGSIYPHVHAKVLVRDDEEIAIGSANLDATSAYWESEAIVVVENAPFARHAAEAFALLIAGGRRVDLASASWRREAARRAWLGRNWPTLVG